MRAGPLAGLSLDRSLFHPTGGGQPGDGGHLQWPGGAVTIATAIKAGDGQIALVPDGGGPVPDPGAEVEQPLDWDRQD